MRIAIDIETVTLGEMEQLEELTGLGFADAVTAVQKNQATMKVLVAVVYVFGRREDPSLTLEAVRAMRLDDVEWGSPGAANPPAAAGGAAGASTGSRSSRKSTGSARRSSGR